MSAAGVAGSGVAEAGTIPSSSDLAAAFVLLAAVAATVPWVAPLPSTRITRSLEPPVKAFRYLIQNHREQSQNHKSFGTERK